MMSIKSSVIKPIKRDFAALLIIVFISCLAVIMILNHWKNWAGFYELPLSVADGFVLIQSKRFFPLVFIPIYMFLISYMMRNDFSEMIIMRRHKRSQIFFAQIAKLSLLTLIYSFLIQGLTWVISYFTFSDLINWDVKNSLYYFNTMTTGDYSVLSVILYSSFMLISIFGSIGLLLIIIRWISNSFVYSWMLEITMCIVYCRLKTDSPFNIFGVEYELWGKNEVLSSHICMALLICIVLSIINLITIKKKDFIK